MTKISPKNGFRVPGFIIEGRFIIEFWGSGLKTEGVFNYDVNIVYEVL